MPEVSDIAAKPTCHAVIYLDRSGADLKPDPLHPPNIRFEARSATELQCSYILFTLSLGTNLV